MNVLLKISFSFFLLFSFSLYSLIPEEVAITPHPQNRLDKRKGKLAICCIFQNEADYLKEWIEYHLLVGTRHFYLYNNCSTDEYLKILMPYIKRGTVELFDVPFNSNAYNDAAKTHNFVQVCCYNHAIQLAKRKNRWLAIIDSDEFICPVKEDNLLKVLKYYEYAAGLVVYWQIYGTSNIWELKPDELLLEKLTWKGPVNYPANILVKSIVNPLYATCKNPHTCSYPKKKFAVTPLHVKFTHTKNIFSPPVDIIRINHYTYRTLSYYYKVKKPRRIRWGTKYPPEMEKSLMDQTNSVHDPVMKRFIPQLKRRMGIDEPIPLI